jgi:hypothetical protein
MSKALSRPSKLGRGTPIWLGWATRLGRDTPIWLGRATRHYATGVEGTVEIESDWTARKREQMGLRPKVRTGPVVGFPPKQA